LDTPDSLRNKMGEEVIIARTRDPNKLAKQVEEKFGDKVRILEDTIRFERSEGHQFVTRLIEAFPGQIDAVTVGRPTLEDVFIQLTGHQFWARKNENGDMK
jgi:ABC-2 type transport system ATP-binding protein